MLDFLPPENVYFTGYDESSIVSLPLYLPLSLSLFAACELIALFDIASKTVEYCQEMADNTQRCAIANDKRNIISDKATKRKSRKGTREVKEKARANNKALPKTKSSKDRHEIYIQLCSTAIYPLPT